MVNGDQITVQFYVDDLKVSHKDHAVLDDFFDDLRSVFGQEDELIENKGLVHEYLGITIDYSIAGKVVFTIFNYLEGVIFKAANDLKNSRSYYPGNNQLFKVDDNSPRLSKKDADISYCMSQDYYLQERGQGLTYKFVLYFYIHEYNHQRNKTTKNSEESIVI